MAHVPECDCGGGCNALSTNTGLCRADTGDPVLVTTVSSCDGTSVVTTITDLATGDPYEGELILCVPPSLSFADTDSIDLSLVAGVFSADLRIDPASEIALSITPDGLFAAAGPDTGGWTTQIKLTDQQFPLSTATDISELTGFQPVANGLYEVEAKLIVSTPNSNIGARLALNFPSGLAHTAHFVTTADQGYDKEVFYYGGPSGLTQNQHSPAANVSYMGHMMGIIDAGNSPGVGNIRPQAAVEPPENGSYTTIHAGSIFKWRKVN